MSAPCPFLFLFVSVLRNGHARAQVDIVNAGPWGARIHHFRMVMRGAGEGTVFAPTTAIFSGGGLLLTQT